MLRRAQLCDSKSSAIHDVEVCFSHRLEYFENNFSFTAEYLQAPAHTDPNLGDQVQWEHPKIRME